MLTYKQIASILLAIHFLYPFNAQAEDKAWLSHYLWPSDRVTFYGRIYFNATRSGIQGEQYLLNQQLSNIKLYSNAKLTNNRTIHAVFIYNTVPTPINPLFYFDELFLELKDTESPWSTEIGRKWVPFGSYKNDLIYKPLTKALGQTNEYGVILAWENHYYAKMALFGPHTKIISSRFPFYYAINLGVKQKAEHAIYDIGISYLYSLAESQLFQYNKGFGGFLNKHIHSHVNGIATYINVQHGQWNTNLSYVTAINRFNRNEFSFDQSGARPTAISIQQGYKSQLRNTPYHIIGFYDYTFESLGLRLPKRRVGLGLNLFPHPYLDLQFQYAKDFNYTSHDVSIGLGKVIKGNSTITNTVAMQLVVNF